MNGDQWIQYHRCSLEQKPGCWDLTRNLTNNDTKIVFESMPSSSASALIRSDREDEADPFPFFCQWGGITCENYPPFVWLLELPSNNLAGTILPSIGKFESLISIDLHSNPGNSSSSFSAQIKGNVLTQKQPLKDPSRILYPS